MAIIKAARGAAARQSVGKAISYAAYGAERKPEPGKEYLTAGINCDKDPARALNEFKATKERWGKTDGRQHKHYIVSYKPGEIAPAKALELATNVCQKRFGDQGYEVFLGVHIDRAHIHVHCIVNSVNFENGLKLQEHKNDLQQMKDASDKLCVENGLSVIYNSLPKEQAKVRAYNMNEYQVMLKGQSWKVDAARALEKSLCECKGQGWDVFKESMRGKGYDVAYRGTKHVTITDGNGNKVRANNLAKTFNIPQFNREGIEAALKAREHKQQQEKPEVKAEVEKHPPHIAQFLSYKEQGYNDKMAAFYMTLRNGFDKKQISEAIKKHSRECPEWSNQSRPYVEGVLKSVEKATTAIVKSAPKFQGKNHAHRFKKGGGPGMAGPQIGGGGGGLSQPEKPKLQPTQPMPSGGGMSMSRGKSKQDLIQELIQAGLTYEQACAALKNME